MNPITPNWSAPSHISALTTIRSGGISQAPFASNNLALHVDDDSVAVYANRKQLRQTLNLPAEPIWLTQTHSAHCVIPEEDDNRIADASISRSLLYPLAIMTADCLPILLCDRFGEEIAAIHAGWRGLAAGVIEATLAKLRTPLADMLAWIGPAICENCFEVGEEVLSVFQTRYPFAAKNFHQYDHTWRMDLSKMAADVLQACGVFAVSEAKLCTYEQKNYFYSYRRESQTGRMASLIWFNTSNRT